MGVPGSGFPAWLRKGKALGGARGEVTGVGVSKGLFFSLGACEDADPRRRFGFRGRMRICEELLLFVWTGGVINSAVLYLLWAYRGLADEDAWFMADLGLTPVGVLRTRACCSRSGMSRSESLATSLVSAIPADEFQLVLSELTPESFLLPAMKNGRGGARGGSTSSSALSRPCDDGVCVLCTLSVCGVCEVRWASSSLEGGEGNMVVAPGGKRGADEEEERRDVKCVRAVR